ncbi:hypothetical protein B0H14DRAFT_3556320 [Mycena olivaceomarginata]|nr:hypothetical protein B0H14DRAFT_3556320 [Mycena olivaceomarginata]
MKYGSHSNATSQILINWNTASLLYKSTFNVSLGIVELQIQDEVSDGVGLWHLMSGCPTGSEVGTVWLATFANRQHLGASRRWFLERLFPRRGLPSDAKTCKFKLNALCDPDSSPCCTAQCGFVPTM